MFAECVIRTEAEFTDKTIRYKRLIIVTNDIKKPVLSVTTTSKTPSRSYYFKNNIYVPANKESMFEKNTYIQLHRLFECPIEKLQIAYNKRKLDVLGEISKVLLDDIYISIEISELIESKHIKRILSERKL